MLFFFVAAGLGLVFLAHTAPFPFVLDAATPARSFWRFPPRDDGPTVYLTFDDGPNPAATPALLDVLAQQHAVATFFLIDRHLSDTTAPIVRRMFDEGHGVALHSHTRRLMVMTPEELAAELQAAAEHIERLAGRRPCPAFRPHGGWRSGQMYAGLQRIDHALVGWGWGLWDFNWFRARNPAVLAERLSRRMSDGDIVVIHDGHHEDPRADRRYAIETAMRLIPALRARGFRFGTVCEALSSDP
jgi:peptidoglycan/xylan/chitin deacetylase (PgdA/CDA1 family)